MKLIDVFIEVLDCKPGLHEVISLCIRSQAHATRLQLSMSSCVNCT